MASDNQQLDENAKVKADSILEKSPMSGIAVPIAIVLVGALIIFGVTKMLSNGKSYKDLVNELHSKTFGNRWVAAYELSKFIAAEKIPVEEQPWLIENLESVYKNTIDHKTRNFVVIALGALRHEKTLPVMELALSDSDKEVRFNAVVALGNMPTGFEFNWDKLINLLKIEDDGLKQVVALTLAQHKVSGAEREITKLLASQNKILRYAAATGLIYFKSVKAVKTLEEILNLQYSDQSKDLNGAQVESLKLNVINAIFKTKWNKLTKTLQHISKNDSNVKIQTKAIEVLNLLKN